MVLVDLIYGSPHVIKFKNRQNRAEKLLGHQRVIPLHAIYYRSTQGALAYVRLRSYKYLPLCCFQQGGQSLHLVLGDELAGRVDLRQIALHALNKALQK
ncbi:hypothetical protein D3C79_1014120 [compost metagenome]